MVWFVAPENMPRQKDSVNCGLYVIYYMNVIGREESFDINFNPNIERSWHKC